MDHFVAPQFIDVEDRIIGPITTRQFIIMVIGGVVIFAAYKILDTAGFILLALITALAVIVFGFVKINGRRFHEFVGSIVEAIKRPKVRVWYKYVPISEVMADGRNKPLDTIKTDFVPRQSIQPKKLRDLALIVDTGGRYQG
ncbi:hypothetical protein CO134_00055 [Candidatus Kuenenbacteria bacterium CG_4_9_14_3_um_filter_39_14]|uniref:PrgI family protein n=4 Tax=Candidatus Kueneniibacteriota TaxID=1752740 RepID=A0A2M7ILA9_9BACT|nr:MAG: hypothetical protein AUK13_01965 [Candidatus Kuenenbacteria bacterium CG2_30_39_24]PIP75836.1 MAG: hypothetical protein COW86_01485 [Candidatus Kuenenbacteria bacterium CG22_combo_CG10-13_8_21_14_all_39_9]PIW95622.1 MAG: hypothetical protein COZ84_02490 [Candidatus Kuenenbacteria bacterium CG_4_8_14_3_um_filter_39_15]PJA92445.1 MAG: hypothetical protein CO134_00055 [Candidatus Kuenenbacteria bacterium CG_4_9_14_3_um_filter_39_14]